MTELEFAVLEAYYHQDDGEGSHAPYHHAIAAAAGGNIALAYAACKRLKKQGLLDCNGRQRGDVLAAPHYWITVAGRAALS